MLSIVAIRLLKWTTEYGAQAAPVRHFVDSCWRIFPVLSLSGRGFAFSLSSQETDHSLAGENSALTTFYPSRSALGSLSIDCIALCPDQTTADWFVGRLYRRFSSRALGARARVWPCWFWRGTITLDAVKFRVSNGLNRLCNRCKLSATFSIPSTSHH